MTEWAPSVQRKIKAEWLHYFQFCKQWLQLTHLHVLTALVQKNEDGEFIYVEQNTEKTMKLYWMHLQFCILLTPYHWSQQEYTELFPWKVRRIYQYTQCLSVFSLRKKKQKEFTTKWTLKQDGRDYYDQFMYKKIHVSTHIPKKKPINSDNLFGWVHNSD